MDQALKKTHHETAKARLGLMHFYVSIANWNIIKQDQSKFATFLSNVCSLDEDEYSTTTATWQILLTKPKLTENQCSFCLKVPNQKLTFIETTIRLAFNRSLPNHLTT